MKSLFRFPLILMLAAFLLAAPLLAAAGEREGEGKAEEPEPESSLKELCVYKADMKLFQGNGVIERIDQDELVFDDYLIRLYPDTQYCRAGGSMTSKGALAQGQRIAILYEGESSKVRGICILAGQSAPSKRAPASEAKKPAKGGMRLENGVWKN